MNEIIFRWWLISQCLPDWFQEVKRYLGWQEKDPVSQGLFFFITLATRHLHFICIYNIYSDTIDDIWTINFCTLIYITTTMNKITFSFSNILTTLHPPTPHIITSQFKFWSSRLRLVTEKWQIPTVVTFADKLHIYFPSMDNGYDYLCRKSVKLHTSVLETAGFSQFQSSGLYIKPQDYK